MCIKSDATDGIFICPSLFYKDKERFYLLFLIMSSLKLTGVTITCHMLACWFLCVFYDCIYIYIIYTIIKYIYIYTYTNTHTHMRNRNFKFTGLQAQFCTFLIKYIKFEIYQINLYFQIYRCILVPCPLNKCAFFHPPLRLQ